MYMCISQRVVRKHIIYLLNSSTSALNISQQGAADRSSLGLSPVYTLSYTIADDYCRTRYQPIVTAERQ